MIFCYAVIYFVLLVLRTLFIFDVINNARRANNFNNGEAK
jgi:hypothetical protein